MQTESGKRIIGGLRTSDHRFSELALYRLGYAATILASAARVFLVRSPLRNRERRSEKSRGPPASGGSRSHTEAISRRRLNPLGHSLPVDCHCPLVPMSLPTTATDARKTHENTERKMLPGRDLNVRSSASRPGTIPMCLPRQHGEWRFKGGAKCTVSLAAT